jgi:hypothetical protein
MKKGLELDTFTQKISTDYNVDHSMFLMLSHNLVQKKVSVIRRMHQNELQNTEM